MWKTDVHQREDQWTKLLGPHGAEAGKPVLPLRHFNNSGSNIPNPLHRRERRKEHRNRTCSDSSPRNNQQRISDVSSLPPPSVIISFKYFNLSEFDIPIIIRNLSTFFALFTLLRKSRKRCDGKRAIRVPHATKFILGRLY